MEIEEEIEKEENNINSEEKNKNEINKEDNQQEENKEDLIPENINNKDIIILRMKMIDWIDKNFLNNNILE